MSGRYSLHHWPAEWEQLPGFPENLVARWNVAPRDQVLMLYQAEGCMRAGPVLWGFTPGWSRDFSQAVSHARSETLGEQPLFCEALRQRRCVLPATGFYEWRGPSGTRKQPYWLSRPGQMLYMAALWEPFIAAGHEYRSAAMLTCQAAYLRRPLLLDEDSMALWLSAGTDRELVMQLLSATSSPVLKERKVSTLVNDPANDGPACIRPLGVT